MKRAVLLIPIYELILKQRDSSVAWVRRRELYRPSDRRLLAKLVHTLADRGCRVVRATNPPQSLISVSL
jgi:hypothetical protein